MNLKQPTNNQKFATLLGFSNSILHGYTTGGTQVGRNLTVNERSILVEKIGQIEKSNILKEGTELTEAFDGFREVVLEMLNYGKEDSRPERIRPLFDFVGVKSLSYLRSIENDFGKESKPVEEFILAAKLLSIYMFYKEKSIEFGLKFKKDSEVKDVPSIPETDHFFDLSFELKDKDTTETMDFFVKFAAIEEAMKVMHCTDQMNISRNQSKPQTRTTVRRTKLAFGRKGSLPSIDPATSSMDLFNLPKPSFSMTFRRKKKKKSSSGNGSSLFNGQINDPRRLVKSIFTISMLFDKFFINVPVAPLGTEISPDSVPQVFQETYHPGVGDIQLESRSAKSFDVYENYSAILYHNSIIEVFKNDTQETVLLKRVCYEAQVTKMTTFEGYLVLTAGSNLILLDLTPPTLEECRTFAFRGNAKSITSVMTMASFFYIGFQDGSIAVWAKEPNKEVATCRIVQEIDDEDIKLVVPYETSVTHLCGDSFTEKIASALSDGLLCFWKGVPKDQTKMVKNVIKTRHGEITALVANNGEVFTGGTDGCIRIWDINSEKNTIVIKRAHYDVKSLMSPGGARGVSSAPKKPKRGRTRRQKGRRRQSNLSSANTLTDMTGSDVKTPYAVTSIAVHHDMVFSSGRDRSMKIWDLSLFKTKLEPKIIQKSSQINELKVVGRHIYALGEQLDRYEISGLIASKKVIKQVSPMKLYQKDISFNFTPAGIPVKRDESQPELVMKVENQASGGNSVMDLDVKSITLDKALKNKPIRKEFMKFLRNAYADENLEFYIVCIRFVRFYDSLPEKTRERECRKILHKFIEVGSEKQINISDTERRRLLSQSTTSKDMFSSTIKEVYHLMNSNFFVRFRGEIKRMQQNSRRSERNKIM